jgi:pilus assembly protein CpaE
MARRALLVTGGPEPDDVAGVLQRFGFAESVQALTIDEAVAYLHADRFDVVIVPLQDVAPMQLASLDREARRWGSTFVIGTAAKADSDLILRAMRSGVHEFLLLPLDAGDFAAAVDRLMRRNSSQSQRGRVYAVYSGKGGVGVSTIAVNLAHALGRVYQGSRVALVDLVVSGGDVRILLDLRSGYDMGDLLSASSGGVWALPSPDDPELDTVLDGNAVSAVVEHLKGDFAFTVLDCEHHLSDRTLAALDAADRVVLLTELNVPALRSTQRTLALCRRLGYVDDKLCVVVNRQGSGEVLTLADAADVLKCEMFWRLPNDYRAASAALAKGVPIAEHDASSKLAGSLAQMAGRLAGMPVNGRNGAGRMRLGNLFGMAKKRG